MLVMHNKVSDFKLDKSISAFASPYSGALDLQQENLLKERSHGISYRLTVSCNQKKTGEKVNDHLSPVLYPGPKKYRNI
ncbi:hypothetical protein SAMN06265171_101637 [Chryseobacterium rhizoplanae]|uniref:Uncharacterized protein n=2 Tax=Chryseobacterium rhizoplanae TaxID=1609531 RepID=A0A521B365_9FLAO|nr:hypothetical protein SAMN06265171_101637 [Chryseobacterium rhizoplanae]